MIRSRRELMGRAVPEMGEPEERIVSLGGAAGGLASGRVQMFRLRSVSDDHLVCRTWDGTTEGDADVLVAKPEELRKTPWHGKTIGGIAYSVTGVQARTATQGTTSESQVVIPTYQAAVTGYGGSLIYAVRPKGGTGVTVGDAAVIWQDLNVAGRAWAEVTA